MSDSDQQRAAQLAAVVEERRGYAVKQAGAEAAGNDAEAKRWAARVADCDKVLGDTAVKASPRAARSTKRGTTV